MITFKSKILKTASLVFLLFLTILAPLKSYSNSTENRQLYDSAFNEIRLMLEDSIPADFKRAVFLTENAYFDDALDYLKYCNLIDYYAALINSFLRANPITYDKEDYQNVAINSAIFHFMTVTIFLSKDSVLHYPYKYDFDDFDGSNDWSSMFVTNLLQTQTGNCHSMPFLYKILADELGAKAYLSLAPYHMYIKSYCERSGWYNTELTSAMFPVDAWISASGYVQLEAIKSGIYMDTLSNKQSIAFCLFDLAKGYEKQYGFKNNSFIFDCLDLALEYYPNFVNAMIYKAESLKKRFDAHLILNDANDFKEILHLEIPNQIYTEMEGLYTQVIKYGYREMPEEMYNEWFNSLKNGTDKYQNKQILHIFQNQ